jgi:hypothetical protein
LVLRAGDNVDAENDEESDANDIQAILATQPRVRDDTSGTDDDERDDFVAPDFGSDNDDAETAAHVDDIDVDDTRGDSIRYTMPQ